MYDAAMAVRTKEAVDAYLGCFRSEMGFTAAYGGMSLAVSGVEELRAAIENLFAAGLSHVHRDVRVVRGEPDRAVAHYTRLISQDGTPLIEVEIECDVAFQGELIRRMAIRERGPPGDAPVLWAPLGSTPSFGGEIVGHWADEKLLVRLRDGRECELPAPADADGQWNIGDPVIVFFEGPAPLGWYLPERQLGVDLRGVGR